MPDTANDEFFDIKKQLAALTPEKAIEFAFQFLDHHCSELDAEYLKKAINAGDQSIALARDYAVSGSSAAQFVYGTATLHGNFVEQNVSEGLFWLRRAHNNGNTKASMVLCGAYLQGILIGRNAHKAAEYAEAAAQKGDPAGQYIYATLLIEGQGVAQDEEAAILWLQRSAQAGYEKSKSLLIDNSIPLSPDDI